MDESTRRTRIQANLNKTPEQRAAEREAVLEARAAQAPIGDDVRAGIQFVGTVLAPFFMQDPRTGEAQASYDAMREIDVAAAAKEWPFVDDAVAEAALAAMKDELVARHDEQPEPIDDELSWEFRRLFEGPAKKIAPPWGSVYTDYECVIFGESTLALRTWVRENEVVEATNHATPEDHIGLMLEQMAWISENRPELLREYLRDHMFTWTSHFLDLVESETKRDFYRGLAQLTRASLEGIQAELGVEVEYPRYYR